MESATEPQRAVLGEILAGPRGDLAGPFLSWIHSPVLASHAQRLGAFCRYETGLPPRQSELAILITAERWKAHAEWLIHAPIALAAGLPNLVLEALRRGVEPDFTDGDDALVYSLASELYRSQRVSDEIYDCAVERWGEKVVVNLVGLLGYYSMVAITLNVFRVTVAEKPGSTNHG